MDEDFVLKIHDDGKSKSQSFEAHVDFDFIPYGYGRDEKEAIESFNKNLEAHIDGVNSVIQGLRESLIRKERVDCLGKKINEGS